jgi:heat shock protein HslJ
MKLKNWSMAAALASTTLVGCTTASQSMQTAPTASTVTLQSHHWQLQQAFNAQGAADVQWRIPSTQPNKEQAIKLRFGDNQLLSVDRLCNVMGGRYQVEAQRLTIDKMMSTMMACNHAGLMQLEQKVAQTLPLAAQWKITPSPTPALEIQFTNGTRWQLQGTPTYETLYGQSERIFLEVAPQKVACNHPLIADAQCLQVREVRYSDQGLKQGSGEWQNFYATIDGYTHQVGVRNVLRLKRYTRSVVPADASRYVYLLDMTVESEIVH